MKKRLMLILLAVLCVALLAACNGAKEFSHDMPVGKEAYADLVSFTPMYQIQADNHNNMLLYRCRTAKNEQIWIAATDNASLGCLADEKGKAPQMYCTISKAVRVNGTVSDGSDMTGLPENIDIARILVVNSGSREEYEGTLPDDLKRQDFFAALEENMPVYAQIVAMQPERMQDDQGTSVVVRCETANGKTLSVSIPAGTYKAQFDTNADLSVFRTNRIVFEKPIRIAGYTTKDYNLESSTTDLMMEYIFVDSGEIHGNATWEPVYLEYTDESVSGQLVCVEILSIKPKSIEVMGPSPVTFLANPVRCVCTTQDGEVCVYIAEADYIKIFNNGKTQIGLGEEERFITPIPVACTVRTEYELKLERSWTGSSVLVFESTDQELVAQNKYSNQEPVAYTSDVEQGLPVYVDIASSIPTVLIGNMFHIEKAVCKCVTTDGQEVYIYMDPSVYTSQFDTKADLSSVLSVQNTKRYRTPLRVYGIKYSANSLFSGLGDKLKSEYVINYKSIEQQQTG